SDQPQMPANLHFLGDRARLALDDADWQERLKIVFVWIAAVHHRPPLFLKQARRRFVQSHAGRDYLAHALSPCYLRNGGTSSRRERSPDSTPSASCRSMADERKCVVNHRERAGVPAL